MSVFPLSTPSSREPIPGPGCMEVWNGNGAIHNAISVPGIDVWASSDPFRGEARGGDIHYVSMCDDGRLSRFAVMDVAGHGAAANDLGRRLRWMMRKHGETFDQAELARAINRDLLRQIDDGFSGQFATAVLTAYDAQTDHLIVCNNWLSYVSVESADATTEKATSLGGEVFMGPMDVGDKGRMTIIQDPTGATFALWEPKSHKGAAAYGEVGASCWNELITSDTAKAGEFYSSLFGWTLQEKAMGPMTYTMFMQGETLAGGMMATPPEMGEAPPNWMVYFAVGDCDEEVQHAQTLGAKVFSPAMDIPEVGRMAVLADPQGAVFSIIKLALPPT